MSVAQQKNCQTCLPRPNRPPSDRDREAEHTGPRTGPRTGDVDQIEPRRGVLLEVHHARMQIAAESLTTARKPTSIAGEESVSAIGRRVCECVGISHVEKRRSSSASTLRRMKSIRASPQSYVSKDHYNTSSGPTRNEGCLQPRPAEIPPRPYRTRAHHGAIPMATERLPPLLLDFATQGRLRISQTSWKLETTLIPPCACQWLTRRLCPAASAHQHRIRQRRSTSWTSSREDIFFFADCDRFQILLAIYNHGH